jgi:hypothetical protein
MAALPPASGGEACLALEFDISKKQWANSAREAGVQRVAPGAAKRSRGPSRVSQREPARRATGFSLIGVRFEIGVICPKKRLLVD